MPNRLIVLRGTHCHRSQRVLAWLEEHRIPFTFYELTSTEGQALAEQYEVRTSPGLIKNGRAINPFYFLHECKVDEPTARVLLEP